nr:hypothetical protein [uncultured bacterium]
MRAMVFNKEYVHLSILSRGVCFESQLPDLCLLMCFFNRKKRKAKPMMLKI